MIIATLLCGLLVLQAPATVPVKNKTPSAEPIAKNAAPIAATKQANIGSTVDVPAALAALVSTDAAAVIYIPNAAAAEATAKQIAALGGPIRGMVPSSKAIMSLLKAELKTDLEIPMDQPLLFWMIMPVADENDPNQDMMGGPDIRSFMAMKIPGATKDNVKSRTKRTSISLLANDMVVVGAQKAPYEMPAAGAATCALLKQLPAGVVSGRLDLETIMREQADTLRMGASFIGMTMSQASQLDKDATQEQKDAAQVKEQMSAALSDQAMHLVDILSELKSASFSLTTVGDQLNVWTDWTRDAPWPAGINAEECAADLALLPASMLMYAGVSKNTMGNLLHKQFTIDDAAIMLGSTPEQRQAWKEAEKSTRDILNLMNAGIAGGFGDINGKPGYMIGFRVTDMAAFQAACKSTVQHMLKVGLYSDIQLVIGADSMSWTMTPDVKRFNRMAMAFNSDMPREQLNVIAESVKPTTTIMNFKGNNVTMVAPLPVTNDFKVPVASAKDIRGEINAKAWGDIDWFATFDMRVIASWMASTEMDGFALPSGPAAMLSIGQGVQGGTQRISISADMKGMGTLMEQYEKESMRVRMEKRKKAATSNGAATKDDAGKDDEDDGDDGDDGAETDASMPGAP